MTHSDLLKRTPASRGPVGFARMSQFLNYLAKRPWIQDNTHSSHHIAFAGFCFKNVFLTVLNFIDYL